MNINNEQNNDNDDEKNMSHILLKGSKNDLVKFILFSMLIDLIPSLMEILTVLIKSRKMIQKH